MPPLLHDEQSRRIRENSEGSSLKNAYISMKIDKISLDKNSRMLRIGFGKNEGRWFFRIDLWFAGYRIKK
jgi:hypothetical protein